MEHFHLDLIASHVYTFGPGRTCDFLAAVEELGARIHNGRGVMDPNKEPPKQSQQNAATGFGFEDHEATGADPRVNAFRAGEDKRRASVSSKSQTRIHPQNTANVPGPSPAPTGAASPSDGEQPRKISAVNAAVNYGMEEEKASAQDQRVKNIKEEHFRRHRSQMSLASLHPAVPNPPPKPNRISDIETSETDGNQDTLPSDVPNEVTNEKRTVEPATKRDSEVESRQVSIKVDPDPEPAPLLPAPPAPPSPPPPEPARNSLELAPKQEFRESPQRPEDVPMPPPTMSADDDLEEKGDVHSALSKLTNTDVTFDPSKAYACKGTNTTPDPSGLIYTEESEREEEASDEEAEENLPDVVPAENVDQLFLLACREVRSVGTVALTESNKEENKQIASRNPNQHAISPAGNAVEEMFIKAISSRYPDHK